MSFLFTPLTAAPSASHGEYADDVLIDNPLSLLDFVNNGEYSGTGTIPNLGTAGINADHNVDQGGKSISSLIPRCDPDHGAYDLVASANQYVHHNDATTWQFTTAWTLEAWIRAGSLPSFGSEMGIISKPGAYEMILRDTGEIGGWVDTGSGYNVWSGSTTISTGEVHHVAVTFGSSKLIVYVDGVKCGETSTGSSTASGSGYDLWFGTQNDGSSEDFEGAIQWPAVYNTTLTAQQVRRHYNMGAKKNRVEPQMQSAESSSTVLWESDSNVASITRQSGGGGHGEYFFRATADSDGGQMALRQYNSTTRETYEACLPNRTYSARLKLKNGSSRSAYIQLAQWDSSYSLTTPVGNTGASSSDAITTTGGWDLHALDVGDGQAGYHNHLSSATAAYIGVVIIVPGASGSETVDFDAIEVYDGKLPTDADLPAASWLGGASLTVAPATAATGTVTRYGDASGQTLTTNQHSVETDTTGFESSDAGLSISRDNTRAYVGTYSLMMENNEVAAVAGTLGGTSGIAASPGQGWTGKIQIYSASIAFTPRLYFYNSSGTLISYTDGPTYSSSASWQEASVSAVAPALTAYAALKVYTSGSGAVRTLWADAWVLSQSWLATTSASGTKTHLGEATLTTSPATAASGLVTDTGAVAVTPSVALATTGTASKSGAVSVATTPTLDGVGATSKPLAASIAVSPAVAAIGTGTKSDSAAATAEAITASSGTSSKPLAASLTVGPALASTGSVTQTGVASDVPVSPVPASDGWATKYGDCDSWTGGGSEDYNDGEDYDDGEDYEGGGGTLVPAITCAPTITASGDVQQPIQYGDASLAVETSVSAAGIISDYGNADLVLAPTIDASGSTSKPLDVAASAEVVTYSVGTLTQYGTASVTATASTTADGSAAKPVSTDVSVSPTTASAGYVTSFRTAELTVSPTASSSGLVTDSGEASLVVTPATESSGTRSALGSAAVVPICDTTATGTASKPLTTSLTVTPTTAASGLVTDFGDASISVAPTVAAAAAGASKPGAVSLGVTPITASASLVLAYGDATVGVSAATTASGDYTVVANAAVTPSPVTAASGEVQRLHLGEATLTITPYLVAAEGTVTDYGDAPVTTDIAISGGGVSGKPLDATLGAAAATASTSAKTVPADASLTASPATAAVGGKMIYGDASVTVSPATSADGYQTVVQNATLIVAAGTQADLGLVTKPLIADLTVSPTVDASGAVTDTGSADATVSPGTDGSGVSSKPLSAAVTPAVAVAASGYTTQTGTASVAITPSTDASATVAKPVSASVTATVATDTSAARNAQAVAALAVDPVVAGFVLDTADAPVVVAPVIESAATKAITASAAVTVTAGTSADAVRTQFAAAAVTTSPVIQTSATVDSGGDVSLAVSPATQASGTVTQFGAATVVTSPLLSTDGSKAASDDASLLVTPSTSAAASKFSTGETVLYPLVTATSSAVISDLGDAAVQVDAITGSDGQCAKSADAALTVDAALVAAAVVHANLFGDASVGFASTTDATLGTVEKTGAAALSPQVETAASGTVAKQTQAQLDVSVVTQADSYKSIPAHAEPVLIGPDLLAYIAGVIRYGNVSLAVVPTLVSAGGIIYESGAILVIDPQTNTLLVRITYGDADLDVELATAVLAERIGIGHAELTVLLQMLASGESAISGEAALIIQSLISGDTTNYPGFVGWGVRI